MADQTAATEHEPNRLIHETSPYLLQHAYNPVDWYAWGEEAFEAARERGVPILLSVGYSTCYWCHVMERECFEDPEIAALMNERFVCVKVDREERPDVDDIYMTALQILQRGGGGWPMNMFLTPPGAAGPDDPGLKPFYGGTYFPPTARGNMFGFPTVLRNISDAWKNDRQQVLDQAEKLTEAVRRSVADSGETVRVDERQMSQALALLTRIYDEEHGGFGGAPKFPQPVYLDFLLDTIHVLEDPAIRDRVNRAIRHTLDAMSLGGIHDHVGGGFHRYSTDAQWIVPHFEKMLYDNAQLASLYAKAFIRAGDEHDARVTRDVLEYVLREMTDESGLFYSAQDAEVNHREGQNYLWTYEQMEGVLGGDVGFAADIYSVEKSGGNFTDPHHPEDGPTNVLVLRARPDALAEEMGLELAEFLERKESVDRRLYEARQQRDQPGLDDKVITSWNGLMIDGMAMGAMALGEEKYLDAAEKAARAILRTMRDENGDLLRTSRDGVAKTPAFLEDHAFLVKGLLTLHRTNAASGRADLTFINAAHRLTNRAYALFADGSGGLYDTREGQSDLIVRTRETYDGAMPAPTSVMLHNLIELHELTQEREMLDRATALLRSISSEVRASPLGTVNSVRALYRLLRVDPEIADRLGPREGADESVSGDPVRIMAAGERIRVPEGETVELPIRIEIEEGHHINAHDPGVEGLVGLRFELAGSEAVRLDVDYPEGRAYEGSAVPEDMGTLMVHEGVVETTLRLSRTGEAWSGRPLIRVTYQVCTDRACLPPSTVELDVAIDP